MTVSISKMSIDYYLEQVAVGDAAPAGTGNRNLTRYYVTTGAPPGRWTGAGLAGLGLAEGTRVTARAARRLLEHSQHPETGEQLGKPPIAATAAPEGATTPAGKAAKSDRKAVAGFDLTFSVPKSVSVLWAMADEDTKAAIHDAHRQAMNQTVTWLENNVVRTRAGHAGAAAVPVHGLIATSFDHWDSRAGDPQLHTHMVVANRVQRQSDDKWVTLDSYALHKNVVAISERFNGLLFDQLARTLGTQTEIRGQDTADSELPLADRGARIELAGIPDELVEEFSTRSRAIEEEADRLIAQWEATHGHRPAGPELLQLRQQATLATRSAKDPHDMRTLAEKSRDWRDRAAQRGHDAASVLAAATDREPTIIEAGTVTDEHRQRIASRVLATVAEHRSTFSRANIQAETARAIAAVRCHTVEDREQLIEALTDTALGQAVELTPRRFRVPEEDHPGLVIHGDHALNDTAAYTTHETYGAEARLIAAATNDDGPHLSDHDRTREILDAVTIGGGHHLAPDQHAAALEVTTAASSLVGLIGPAGTGKTTTLRAVREAWEDTHGPGAVVGLAPSAVAASVLGREIEVPTDNLAKWLWESEGPAAHERAQRLDATRQQLRELTTTAHGSAAANASTLRYLNTTITALEAEQAKFTLRPGQLVIIDEASMASTHALDRMREQAQAAGAKIVAVGDPAQLGAIDAGGMLGWLERHRDTPEVTATTLTSVWRFSNQWEAENSLALRRGDIEAADVLIDAGRITHSPDADHVEDTAFQQWQQLTADGSSALLIASTQESVDRLNDQAQAAGLSAGKISHDQTATLGDGRHVGVGDTILTRRNQRLVTDSEGEFIKNGNTFTVTDVHPDGTLTATRDTGATVHLPATVLEHTQLGYATTAQRAQGATVDHAIATLDPQRTSREQLYVAMTRGKHSNIAVLPPPEEDLEDTPDPWAMIREFTPETMREQLDQILARSDQELTAHEVEDHAHGWATDLSRLIHDNAYLTSAIGTRQAVQWVRDTHGANAVGQWSNDPRWASIVTHLARGATPPQDPSQAPTPRALNDALAAQALHPQATRHGVLPVPPSHTPAELETAHQLLGAVSTRLDTLREQTRDEPWRMDLVGRPQKIIDAVLLTRAVSGHTDPDTAIPAAVDPRQSYHQMWDQCRELLEHTEQVPVIPADQPTPASGTDPAHRTGGVPFGTPDPATTPHTPADGPSMS